MRYLSLIFLLFISTSGFSQKAPLWVDYANRASMYPDNKYLVGLATEIRIEKLQATSAFERLNQMSRNQIIETIHVSIKAESKMNISVVNTKTDEQFEQLSQSASKAELVGLKFENYYNKKDKTAYSFSYVLIQDIIDYYNDIISSSFDIISKDFSGVENSSDKNTALKLLYDSQLKLREINQATAILVALKQTSGIDFTRITGINKKIEDYSNQILGSAPVTIANIANYFSYGLIPQTEIGSTASVCSGKLSYKDSGAESDFSKTLNGSILNIIGGESSLSMAADEETDCIYELSGNYQDSDNELIVAVNLIDKQSNNVVASKERTFKKSILALDGLRLLPANFERINELQHIKLMGNGGEISFKTNEFIDKPISFKILLNGAPQKDLPVIMAFYKDGQLAFDATVISNKAGEVQFSLNKELVPKSTEYELWAYLDIATLLDLDTNADFYQNLLRDNPIQVRKIQLKVTSPTVYVISSEMSLGSLLQVPILEPSVKNAFAELDYEFVENENDADMILTIVAATRSAQSAGNFRTSYLDATISLTNRKTRTEVYKKSLSSIKGTSASFELGSIKAYEKARNEFMDDLVYELRFNNK